jgi:prepilin-type N-terminal cleavage/methylation domain-containing protein
MNTYIKTQKGYTLVELLVAMAVFITVVTVVSSLFINLLRESKRVSAARGLVDQARVVLDQIRFDLIDAQTDYYGILACFPTSETFPLTYYQGPGLEDQIVFIASDGTCNGYAKSLAGQISKMVNIVGGAPSDIIPITDPSVQVNKFDIRIFEDGLVDQQPFVEISMELESLNEDGLPPLRMQKTISKNTTPFPRRFETCTVSYANTSPVCPFREDDLPIGSVVVNFLTDTCDNGSNFPDSCITGSPNNLNMARSQKVTTSIPADTYKVIAVAHGGHIIDIDGTPDPSSQPEEQYFMSVANEAGTFKKITSDTDDIPDDENCVIDTVEDSFVISSTITNVYACHASPIWNPPGNDCSGIDTVGSVSSVQAVCAVFIPVI